MRCTCCCSTRRPPLRRGCGGGRSPGRAPPALTCSAPRTTGHRNCARCYHPLLRSWGRPTASARCSWLAAETRGLPAPLALRDAEEPSSRDRRHCSPACSDDLRSGRSPAGDFELALDDRSVQVHSCHGQARQVQVLRDVILHLLDDDPSLSEEDIAVLSPAIDQFAPLVEAGFGARPAEACARCEAQAPATPRPGSRYRITDRSLRESYPALAALDSLLALVSGRFSASEVLEFVSLPRRTKPIRARRRSPRHDHRLGATGQRALGARRSPASAAGDFRRTSRPTPGVRQSTACSWEWPSATTPSALRPGDIAPLGVEASDIAVAGRLAELVCRLAACRRNMAPTVPPLAWCETLVGRDRPVLRRRRRPSAGNSTSSAASSPRSETRQWSETSPPPSSSPWPISAACSPTGCRDRPAALGLLPGRHHGQLAHPAALAALPRHLPARPRRGRHERHERHRRRRSRRRSRPSSATTTRALRSARRSSKRSSPPRDHLVITRTGHNVRTNREVPSATVLAELRDTITATLAPKDRDAYWHRIETVHPCQPFDERCFTPGRSNVRIPGVSMRARSPGPSPASTGRATTPRSSPVPCPWLRLSGLDSAGHRSALASSRGFSTIP